MLKEAFHIAVPTAFFEDESINIEGTIAHINYLYKQGVKSVLVSGSTGEQHSLNLKEKVELLDRLVLEDELITNMEILFGVSSIRQKEAEELAKKIQPTKISGILLGFPPYVLPTQEEALVYATTIIHLCNKPTILYNNPKRTGFDLSVNSIIQLSLSELVVGLKEAGQREKVKQLKNNIERSNFYYYAGGEVELEEKIQQGFDRLSSIGGNISPLEILHWFTNILANKAITQHERDKIESTIHQIYNGSPLVNLKKSINEQGIQMGICRSPIGNL
ncbi:dihydrodipicolinate synthase family protein [Cytobacillus suaedae]|nr:dihydrodipicolinate synthase family protein [Cytobacillus suaedae]